MYNLAITLEDGRKFIHKEVTLAQASEWIKEYEGHGDLLGNIAKVIISIRK